MAVAYRLIVLLCICSALLSGCGPKDDQSRTAEFEIDKDFQRGPLAVHVRLDKSSLTIAQTLLLQLEATVEEGYEVTMPEIDEALQQFGLVDWRNLGDRLDENNNLVKTYNYKLEPLISGTFAIPAFVFEFVKTQPDDAEEKTYQLETKPIDIEVTSLLGEDRAELVIADIADVVQLPKKTSPWPIAIVAVVIVAVAVLIVWVRLRRGKSAGIVRIFRPAHEIAYERLSALVAAKLIEAGRLKEFYERISNILRHYIEDRFDLMAPERTTEEFLFELQYTQALSVGDKDSLGEFLRHCDLVKFARHQPTTEQIQKTFDLVKEFIEKTKSDQSRIDVTDMKRTERKAEGTHKAEVA